MAAQTPISSTAPLDIVLESSPNELLCGKFYFIYFVQPVERSVDLLRLKPSRLASERNISFHLWAIPIHLFVT